MVFDPPLVCAVHDFRDSCCPVMRCPPRLDGVVADFVVTAQGKGAILACKAIAVTPVFATLRCDEQMQTATIKQFARTFGRQGVFDGFVCEGHKQKNQVTCPDSTPKKCPRFAPA